MESLGLYVHIPFCKRKCKYCDFISFACEENVYERYINALKNEIKVVIDDKNQSYDQMPQILNGRTLVPLRGIFEALGAKVEWVDQTKTIIGSKGSNTVILQVESTSAVMNNKKITLDDIADNVYLSRTYISRIFKEEMKVTLTKYINKIRIDKSKQLLLDSSLTLADVANLTGFDDQSYYSKTFRSITGMSPGKYREKHGIHKNN